MTNDRGYAELVHEIHEGRAMLLALAIHAAEITGLLEHTLSKVKHMATDVQKAQAKLDELQEKLAAYKAREEQMIADRDTAIAAKDALIAANQAAVDALNQKIADLQAQVDAGTNPDLTALIADMQTTVDDLTQAQPAEPGETPVK